jgi:hypothetical protein
VFEEEEEEEEEMGLGFEAGVRWVELIFLATCLLIRKVEFQKSWKIKVKE